MSNMRPIGRGASAAVALSLVLAFSAPAASAPTPTPAWTTDVQMDVRTGSVAADRDGNSYVAGSRGTTAPIAVLEKFDPAGGVVWTRTWSPEGGRTHSSGGLVAVGRDGSVYLAGSVSSHYEGGGWFLRKYTPDGALVWARDERGWEHGRASDIPTGLAVGRRHVLLSGYWHGCCGDMNLRDGWVISFGTDGSWRWKNRFEAPGREAFSDEAEGIALGAHGSILRRAAGSRSDPSRRRSCSRTSCSCRSSIGRRPRRVVADLRCHRTSGSGLRRERRGASSRADGVGGHGRRAGGLGVAETRPRVAGSLHARRHPSMVARVGHDVGRRGAADRGHHGTGGEGCSSSGRVTIRPTAA